MIPTRFPIHLALVAVLLIPRLSSAGPPSAWRSVGPGGGGALFAPSFSPYNAAELYVTCDMSELFHSTDTGATWSATPFTTLQAGGDSPKVQFTSNPLVLYMIDNTNELRTPVRSTNGGATWTPLPGDPTGAGAFCIFSDPAAPGRVLLSDYTRLYYSPDPATSFALKYTALSSVAGLAIGGAFFDGSLIVLGTNDGLIVSSNSGASFSRQTTTGIPTGESIVSFAAAKSGGTTRFFCVTLNTADVYAGVRGDAHSSYRAVYSLDWPATTWTPRTTGIQSGHHPFFVDMPSNNVNTAYLAGGSDAGVPIVYKTTNAGSSWQNTFLTSSNQNIYTGWSGAGGDRDWTYGELAFGFDAHPTDPNRAAVTDYGFIHLTTDGGATWRQAYVDPATQNPPGASTPRGRPYRGIGLENTSAWYLAWADADNLWASYSDIRGARSTDAGNTWSFNYTGHTANASYQVVVKPLSPTSRIMYMAASSVHDMYQSTYLTDARIDSGTGNVLFSSNNGATWQTLGSIGRPVIGLALDPTNANRLYASVINSSTGGIYVSSNITAGTGATWTHLPNPPRTQGHPFNVAVLNDGAIVCTYSGRRAGNPLNFTNSSGVFYSTDGGQTWSDRSHSNMLYWTMDITIDPHDSTQSTWYVAVFSGWGGAANDKGGLYRTTNRGQSWTQISTRSRVASCTVNPATPGEMYLTTEMEGLWFTDTLGSPAPTFTQVASYPFRQPERVFFNPFRAGEIWVTSFGHGLRVSQSTRGDCNGNGMFDAAGDTPCFVSVLLGINTDAGAIARSDINGDGQTDALDIPGFVACAAGQCP